ncbi:MAG: class IV adenylate cyclase [Terriglobales bacterium]
MPREVEIKFFVADLKALERMVRAAGFRRITPRTHEMNTLYDLPGIPLRRRGELLRIRRYGKEWRFTHKAAARAGRHKSRAETETVVGDGARLEGILRSLGFQPTFRYEKFRSEWSDGRGHVVLDETPIGNVAEIEGAPRWIDRIAKKLGVAPADYITASYVTLFFDWKASTGSTADEMTFKAVGKKGPAKRR